MDGGERMGVDEMADLLARLADGFSDDAHRAEVAGDEQLEMYLRGKAEGL